MWTQFPNYGNVLTQYAANTCTANSKVCVGTLLRTLQVPSCWQSMCRHKWRTLCMYGDWGKQHAEGKCVAPCQNRCLNLDHYPHQQCYLCVQVEEWSLMMTYHCFLQAASSKDYAWKARLCTHEGQQELCTHQQEIHVDLVCTQNTQN